MNIYITRDNESNLRQLTNYSMSGLINYLLSEYWKTHSVEDIKKSVEPRILKIIKKYPEATKVINMAKSDIIKTPEQAKKVVEVLDGSFISRSYSARRK